VAVPDRSPASCMIPGAEVVALPAPAAGVVQVAHQYVTGSRRAAGNLQARGDHSARERRAGLWSIGGSGGASVQFAGNGSVGRDDSGNIGCRRQSRRRRRAAATAKVSSQLD
jgi:hypothetical protein